MRKARGRKSEQLNEPVIVGLLFAAARAGAEKQRGAALGRVDG
jgi:hypothetical protein